MLAEFRTGIGSGDREKGHEAQLVMLEPVTQQLASLWWRSAVNPDVLITLHTNRITYNIQVNNNSKTIESALSQRACHAKSALQSIQQNIY